MKIVLAMIDVCGVDDVRLQHSRVGWVADFGEGDDD
jgi:hypothetical protein